MSDLIRKFNAWDKAIDASAQGDWREEARDCFAMVAGDQVKDEDKKAAEEKGILYAILNKIDPTVSAICGSEITNRQEIRYYPRQVTNESAQKNEILSAAAEWVREECDAGDEESEAFRDCITCGMGWTETRMSYDVDPDGMPVTERVDPLEMAWDPSAKRPNLSDARYRRRKKRFGKEEAAERFGIAPDAYGSGDKDSTRSSPHDADPEAAYQSKGELPIRKDEIEITEYQWWELEDRVRVANPQTGELEELTVEQYQRVAPLLTQAGAPEGVPFKARCYYRAWRISDDIIKEPEKLPEDDFTLHCVTGKLDRNKGIWYGVVRALRDPQRLLNKQATQLQRIIDVNAKGGLIAERNAFEDPDQAKEDWAASDSIVFMQDGAVANGRVIPKPVGQYPNAIDKMLSLTMELVPGISGVNNEMLGVIDREQAGVVEWQRKEAAYGVLKVFFNSLKRYRRLQGRLLLKLITKYMSDGRLIRVSGQMGDVRYVQLAKQPDTLKYDVIVDEAPAGPNQKERTMLFLMSPIGLQIAKTMPPQMQAKLMEYTPLPAALVAEMQQMIAQMPPQQDPAIIKAQMDAAEKQKDREAQQQQTMLQAEKDMQVAQAQQRDEMARAELQATADREKALLEQDKLQLERERLVFEAQRADQDARIKEAELKLKEAELQIKAHEANAQREEGDKTRQHELRLKMSGDDVADDVARSEGRKSKDEVMMDGFRELIAQMNRPKKLIRDASGRAVGVE